ncbi:Mitochondria-eating protein [Mactra antiquata]
MGGQYSHSVAKYPVLETMHTDGMLHFIQNENKRWTEILNNMKTNSSTLPHGYVKMEMEETLRRWYNLIHTSKETAQLYDDRGQQKHFQRGQSLQKENEHLYQQVAQLRQQLDSERRLTQGRESKKLVPTTDIKDREIASLKVQIQQLETNIVKLEKEKEQLLLRLSKFVGDQLYKNNPDITDLSDQNRPTKLGEMYGELYDNQWTDAYEALTEAGHSENETLETLKLTLMNVFSFCEKKAGLLVHHASGAVDLLFEEYKTSVESMNMKKPPSHLTVVRRNVGQDFQNILLQLRWMPKKNEWEASTFDQTIAMSKQKTKEEIARVKSVTEDKLVVLRKEVALSMIPLVQQAYIEASWNDECIPKMKPFIRQCLFISWMMVVQSPPMLLHITDDGDRFDTNFYRPYTASGPIVNYTVWPAMLLHKGGPVVSKGVAQGRREETLHGRCSPIPKDE